MNSRPNITTQFRLMRIDYPELSTAHRVFDRVREARREALSIGGAVKIEGSTVTLFAKSHAGKTTILDYYLEKRFPDGIDPVRPDGPTPQRTVVAVMMNGVSTYKSFLRQILRSFHDPLPNEGDSDALLVRINNYINRFKTELLIFDEASNLRILKATDNDATQTHNTLRGFPKLGCPIVISGTEEAREKIMSDHQLVSLGDDVSISKLDEKNPEHIRHFAAYCAELGVCLKKHDLFPERSNFIAGNTVAHLFVASGGYRGRVSRLVERVAYIARDAGADRVEICHLEAATDSYSIANRIVSHNPFRENRPTRKGETRVG